MGPGGATPRADVSDADGRAFWDPADVESFRRKRLHRIGAEMGEAVGLATPTASGDSQSWHLKRKGEQTWIHNTRRFQKTDPDAYPTPIPSGQDGLPFGQDAADVQAGPDVQANGQAASNGQQDGLAMAGADVAKPEADPFDLASLRLSQDFASAVGVKRLIKTVPVKKPSKEWFVRTHPDPAYRLQTAVLELKEDRETYLVSPALWPELADRRRRSLPGCW